MLVVVACINILFLTFGFIVYGGEMITYHKRLQSNFIKDYFKALDRSEEIKMKEAELDELITDYKEIIPTIKKL